MKAKEYICNFDGIDCIPSQKQGNYLISEDKLIELLEGFGKEKYKKGFIDSGILNSKECSTTPN